MDAEGEIAVDLRLEGGHVASVSVRSTRRADVARALRGMEVRQALAVVPTLFSICGTAQLTAALEACEAALGMIAGEQQRRARELLCDLEALDNHAFQTCVVWPRLLGQGPAVDPFRRVRGATEALRHWTFAGARWAEPGCVAVSAKGPATALAAELRAGVRHLAPDAALTGDAQALRAWASAESSPTGALVHAVYADGAEGFGAATTPLLPALPATWFEARLADAGFAARPTLDGRPAEAGAVARTADHPAVAALLARSGRTLLTRLVARLADMRSLAGRVEEATQDLRRAPPAGRKACASGSGSGVADTSRGRLAHRVELEAGRVAGWRTVAPTEWSFHPDGVVREALLGAPAADLKRRAEWLVAALDPCVACNVQVDGERDA